MSKKKVQNDDGAMTSIKVRKEIVRRLAIVATHRNTSVMALVEPILRELADREYPKVVDEMQKDL